MFFRTQKINLLCFPHLFNIVNIYIDVVKMNPQVLKEVSVAHTISRQIGRYFRVDTVSPCIPFGPHGSLNPDFLVLGLQMRDFASLQCHFIYDYGALWFLGFGCFGFCFSIPVSLSKLTGI